MITAKFYVITRFSVIRDTVYKVSSEQTPYSDFGEAYEAMRQEAMEWFKAFSNPTACLESTTNGIIFKYRLQGMNPREWVTHSEQWVLSEVEARLF